MDDDTAVGGPEVDEDVRESDLDIMPAVDPRPSRRVRIIGAEQASSVVPPEGFAVTDDPLESDLFEERADSPTDSLDDQLVGSGGPGRASLWSGRRPAT